MYDSNKCVISMIRVLFLSCFRLLVVISNTRLNYPVVYLVSYYMCHC